MSPVRKVTKLLPNDYADRQKAEERVKFFLDRTDDQLFDAVGMFVLLRQVYTNDEAYRVLTKMDAQGEQSIFGHTRGPLYRVTVVTPPDELADRVYGVEQVKPANP